MLWTKYFFWFFASTIGILCVFVIVSEFVLLPEGIEFAVGLFRLFWFPDFWHISVALPRVYTAVFLGTVVALIAGLLALFIRGSKGRGLLEILFGTNVFYIVVWCSVHFLHVILDFNAAKETVPDIVNPLATKIVAGLGILLLELPIFLLPSCLMIVLLRAHCCPSNHLPA